MIVADSNLIATCVLEGAATESARRLHDTDGEWYVPRLWRYEVMNIFATMIKARGMAAAAAEATYSALAAALRPFERDPLPQDVFALVEKYGISGYDAQFVALALKLGCTLYTQDKELLQKFPGTAKPFYVRA